MSSIELKEDSKKNKKKRKSDTLPNRRKTNLLEAKRKDTVPKGS